jgi:uncharacterized membrane protein YuzA (DUF378 family)
MRGSYWIALIVLAIGGLNWLLVGLFNFDLVAAIFGDMSPAARVVYVLVGLAAIWALISSGSLQRPVDHTYREGPAVR